MYSFSRDRNPLPEFRQLLAAEGIHYLLRSRWKGKSSRVGMFVLGMPHFRAYTENEKNFLKAVAKADGACGRRTASCCSKVMHSRNEWVATF